MPLLPVVLALIFVAGIFLHPWYLERRRAAWRALPMPLEWEGILRARVPRFASLGASARVELVALMHVFLREKSFTGCDGMEITDEVRVTIAAEACLLLLGRPGRGFPNLREILVYPAAFVVERLRPEPSGVLQEHRTVLSGESWARGQVILSWDDVVAGAAVPEDGRNVVIHEFAHQLDQEKGYANGAPVGLTRSQRERWAAVFNAEFAQLRMRLAMGEPTLLGAYAATDPAEFFAVASEVYFEQPDLLAAHHPALFAELRTLYPNNWVRTEFSFGVKLLTPE